jgi:toxin ParE1/3/4
LEARIRGVIDTIAKAPESAPRVEGTTDMRVVHLVRYPFSVFYRIIGDTVRILHVRHAARRPWDHSEDEQP